MGLQSVRDGIRLVNRRNEKVFQEFQEFWQPLAAPSLPTKSVTQTEFIANRKAVAEMESGTERKSGKVFANLVSTFCYLSLEGKLGQLLHGRRRQRLLRGHPHAAKHHDDQGEDEEHAARHINEDIGKEVVLPRAHLCPSTEKSPIITFSTLKILIFSSKGCRVEHCIRTDVIATVIRSSPG